ncbi:hypothetical protein [Rhizobium indicum]|nr:hypothetical protein [Rhizobium indicum]
MSSEILSPKPIFSTSVPPISGIKALSGRSTLGCELSAFEADAVA